MIGPVGLGNVASNSAEPSTRTYADMLLKKRDRAVVQDVDLTAVGDQHTRVRDRVGSSSPQVLQRKEAQYPEEAESVSSSLAIASFFDQLTMSKAKAGDDFLDMLGRGLDNIAVIKRSDSDASADSTLNSDGIRHNDLSRAGSTSSASISMFPTQIKLVNLWSSKIDILLADKYSLGPGPSPRDAKDPTANLFEARSANLRAEACR